MKRGKYELPTGKARRWHDWKLMAFWISTIIVIVSIYTVGVLWLFG